MASTTDLRAQEAPRTLGRYQLIKRIAIGGMAEIWVGKSTGPSGFQKVVVLKRILPSLVDRPEFVGMFLDEARIAAALSHANIVQVYDCEVEGGEYFIPMEYLHGEDVARMLRELKRRGERMPLEHALHIVTGVAAGLHYAHEKVGYDGQPMSIVHRDVTPHNVFVTYDGGVKIVDFGIAKASNRWNHTQARVLKGKIPYMSPEQCRAEVLDRRSDVFALGILLYELTTGTRLFRGRSEFEILKRIVEEPVPRPSASVPRMLTAPALTRLIPLNVLLIVTD